MARWAHWFARGRFCELFDLSRWCSVLRRPGPLGGWASANIVFRTTRISVSYRSRRVERPSPDDAEDAIDAVVAWVDGRSHAPAPTGTNIWPILAAMVRLSGWQARSDVSRTMTRSASASRSIRHHAPWVRAIWLVPDNQFHQRSIAARPSGTISALSITVSFFATMSNCSRPSTRWRSKPCCGASMVWPIASLPQRRHDVRQARSSGPYSRRILFQ